MYVGQKQKASYLDRLTGMLFINLESTQSKTIIFKIQKYLIGINCFTYSLQIEQEATGLNDSKKDLGWQLG